MFNRFFENIKRNRLFEPHHKILLAVSGGIDSMVMLNLFEKSNFNYGVVHCNFQLRGADSDKDEDFVRQHVLVHGTPFFFNRFETEEYADLNGISIEMAARELRYRYFEQIRAENNFDFIATAHHLDDLLETFFLNLTRKTGIRGLTGIKEKSGQLIRPMLFTNRKEIEDFARESFISFREDRTNSEVVYQRNFIRHRIFPLFLSMNPAFDSNLAETIKNLRETEEVYTFFIEKEKEKIISQSENELSVEIEELLKSPFPDTVLFEILSSFNFNPKVSTQVFQSLLNPPGKQFFSKSHRLVKDRKYLFVTPLPDSEKRIFYIEEDDLELFAPFDLTIEKIGADNFQLLKDKNIACVSFDKLDFPLLIRKWQQGDYFKPLGMSGFKKISDFLIDEKVPIHKKENVWLLCSGRKVVWIMGYRIDERFKITSDTKTVLKVEIKMN